MVSWNSEYMIRDLCTYRGNDAKLEKSMKSLSISSEAVVTNRNVDDIITRGRLIGEGEFGKTYLHNDKVIKLVEIQNEKQLNNEIESARLNRELRVLKYKTVEKKGTKSILAKSACPIMSGGTSEDIVVSKDKKRYFWFEMIKCIPYDFTNPGKNAPNAPDVTTFLLNIIVACGTLVSEGYLHNDFHMKNVMLYENEKGKLHPIIIDFGMIKHIPDFKVKYLEFADILTFAQVATLLDNCNSNTECLDVDAIETAFGSLKNKTSNMFEKVPGASDSLQYAKNVANFIQTTASGLKWRKTGTTAPDHGRELKNPELAKELATKQEFTKQEWVAFNVTELRHDDYIKSGNDYFEPIATMGHLPLLIKVNLLVAQLSNMYFKYREDEFGKKHCGFTEPEWCGDGTSTVIETAGDVIYEIRNPISMTHEQLWESLSGGETRGRRRRK